MITMSRLSLFVSDVSIVTAVIVGPDDGKFIRQDNNI